LNFVTANSNYIDTSQTLGTPTQVTIFSVASFRSFPSSGCCYGFVMTNGAFLATSMHLNVYNTNNQFNYVVSPGANIFSGNNSIALNQNYVFDFVDDNTAVNFYFNGINTASIAVSYGAKNLGILNIGSWNDTASSRGRFFDGYISEIIIFDRALKTEERRSIEAYLGKKWGIKVS
jgi:hypothetical protein